MERAAPCRSLTSPGKRELPARRAASAAPLSSGRHVEPCREVAAAINARLGDGRAIAIAANISANEQLHALVEETVRAFGQIDVLVCNFDAAPMPHGCDEDRAAGSTRVRDLLTLS